MPNIRVVRKLPEDLVTDLRARRAQSKAYNYATRVHIYQNRDVPTLSAALTANERDDALLADMNFAYVETIVLPGTSGARLHVVGGVAHDAQT